jgi:hypothetical protein
MLGSAQGEARTSLLARCERVLMPWAGVVYRSASVGYATAMISCRARAPGKAGRGGLLRGAWPRSIPGWSRRRRWRKPSIAITSPIETALPRVLVSLRVVLQRVLNLADPQGRRCLGVTRAQLVGEDWRAANQEGRETRTQAIGRLACEVEWCLRRLAGAEAT